MTADCLIAVIPLRPAPVSQEGESGHPAGANIKNNLHRRNRFKKEDFREELARPKSEGPIPPPREPPMPQRARQRSPLRTVTGRAGVSPFFLAFGEG